MSEIKKLLKARGICVIIPTYNNAGTIGKVVKDTLLYCSDVIVVNDGCTDNTSNILSAVNDIVLIKYDVNKGKGHALRCGFRKALELGFSYAITIDADGQHYPKDIETLLDANIKHPGALVMGKRIMDSTKRSAGSEFANKFSNLWFQIQTFRKLEDTQTGYRLYPLKKLHGLSFLTSRYEAELELLVLASWHGTKIVSVPVNVYYPPLSERVSHFRPATDFIRISILNTILCCLAVIYGLPLYIIRKSMTMIRTVYSLVFFIFFSMLVFTPIVWVYVKAGKVTEKKKRTLHLLIYKAARFIMISHGIPGVRFTYSISGKVNFDKPSVIICNHQSHLDLMCQLIFTPKIIFLTNNWVWKNPFYGLIIRNAEYLPINDGIENIMPQLRNLAEKGYSIAVFPEGTRSKDCRIGRFHQGAFYIAEQLGLDIIPMLLYGPGKILPKNCHHLRKGLVHINVGTPIQQDEIRSIGNIKAQASYMCKKYIKEYADLCNKIEQHA